MKKKILLTLAIIAILVCLFSISVSAENRTSISYTDIDGVTHNVPVVKYEDATAEVVASKLGNNATMQSLFIDNGAYAIIKATDGSLTAYPSWYIIKPSGSSADYVAISEIEYGYVNAVSGKNYNRGAILYIEFPEGMTHLRGNSVFGGNKMMYEVNITEIVIPSTVIAAQNNCFGSAPSLKKVFIKENSQMTTISGGSFTGCENLTYIQFENLSQLESIDGILNCNLTGKIDLSKNTKLKSLPANFLLNCSNVTEIALPDSIETIGNNAFDGCTNIRFSSPYLPKNLVSIGTYFMKGCKNINEILIFPEGFTTITDEGFSNTSIADAENGTLNLVFLGEPTKLILDGSSYTGWAKYVNVYFAKYTISDFKGNVYAFSDKDTGILGGKTSQSGKLEFDVASASPSSTTQVSENHMRFFFCGENGKVQASYMLTNTGTDITEDRETFVIDGHTHFGNSVIIENTCGKDGRDTVSCIICDSDIVTVLEATNNHNYADGICDICGKSLCPNGGDHDIKQVAIFENGFLNGGKIVSKCQNAGCTYEEKEANLEPIFVFKGYSAKINGDKMTVSYLVNNASLKAYEEINQKSISFGVVASAAQASESNPISVVNGELKAENNVVMAQVNKSFCGFDFILNGFTSEYYSKALVMCAYVYDDGKVSYLCFNNGVAGQYESAYSISFSEYATKE